MNKRFENYDDEVESLVLAFEDGIARGDSMYFDEEQLEMIIDYYLDQIDIHFARLAVKTALDLFPNYFEIRIRHCRLLMLEGNPKRALMALRELETSYPDDTDVAFLLASLYAHYGSHQRAIQYYLKSIDDGTDPSLIYIKVAKEYLSMGRYKDAIYYCKKSLLISPNHAELLSCLVDASEKEHDLKSTCSFLEGLVNLHPYVRDVWFYLGNCYYLRQDYKEALNAYQMSQAIDPKYEYNYINIAKCYQQQHDIPQAITELRRYLPHTKHPEEIYLLIANIYHTEAHNPTTAAIYYQKVLHADSHIADAWYGLALCDIAQGDYNCAHDHIIKALRIIPQHKPYIETLTNIEVLLGNLEQALITSEGLFAHDPILCRSVRQRGMILMRLNQWEECYAFLHEYMPTVDDSYLLLPYVLICCFKTSRRNQLISLLTSLLTKFNEASRSAILTECFTLCPEMRNDYEIMSLIHSIDDHEY